MTKPYHHGALREALLTAAENIIESVGVDKLTLRATARDADVSHAAPKYHFGDLTGLLSELAALGFDRLSEQMNVSCAAVDDPEQRVVALCRAYVGFAQSNPGLFQLMFRFARLDWSRPALAIAAGRAFAILLERGAAKPLHGSHKDQVTAAMATWSLIHGVSMLIIDGRLGPLMKKFSGPDVETLIEKIFAIAGSRNSGTS